MRQAGQNGIYYTAADSRTPAFDSAFHRAFPLMRGEASAAGEFRAALEAGSQDSLRAYRPPGRVLDDRDRDRGRQEAGRDRDRGEERGRDDNQRGRERGRDRSPQRGHSPTRDCGARTPCN